MTEQVRKEQIRKQQTKLEELRAMVKHRDHFQYRLISNAASYPKSFDSIVMADDREQLSEANKSIERITTELIEIIIAPHI